VNDDPDTNFEVSGTHVGLAFNPQVYRLIGRYLAGVESRSASRAEPVSP